MDAKYKDLHITSTSPYNIPNIVERGIDIKVIEFYEEYIIIVYIKNDIRYEMRVYYSDLERKSITID